MTGAKPEPWWSDDQVTLHLGDCIDVLAAMEPASIDAVVTDPPYGLEFMGKEWDSFAPDRTAYHGDRADTTKSISADDSKPSSRHHVAYAMGRPTFRRCSLCGRREFSGSPCSCPEPQWAYEQPAGTPTRMAAYQAWCQAWAAQLLRVLKPGGHLLAFGGTRTSHRLAAGIEDAGFEIRDSIHWIYGSGFPKSLDVSKAIDKQAGIWRGRAGPIETPNGSMSGANYERAAKGPPATGAAAPWEGWGTALKPAHEPVIVARKPLAGTVAANVLTHGTGALNINGCRVGGEIRVNPPGGTAPRVAMGGGWREDAEPTTAAGRWPPNVLLGPGAAAELDRQSGITGPSLITKPAAATPGDRVAYGHGLDGARSERGHPGSGGASRFFPVFRYETKASAWSRPRGPDGTAHPTVKPVALMAWLARLITPPGGLVLDPFAGTGTTAEACIVEGFRCVLIERDPAYAQLIRTRLDKPIQPVLFGDGA